MQQRLVAAGLVGLVTTSFAACGGSEAADHDASSGGAALASGASGKPSFAGGGGTASAKGGSAGSATNGGSAGNATNGGSGGTGAGGASSSGTSGELGGAGAAGQPGVNADRCSDPNLKWRTANQTTFTSYPDPGSEECVKYNGCMWAGQFAACDAQKTEGWVATHNIVAVFPDFDALALHDLCLRRGDVEMIVTVFDTCADSDCDGCCTTNQGSADELIDLESYTDQRWGRPDGPIEWADLGPTTGGGCDGT